MFKLVEWSEGLAFLGPGAEAARPLDCCLACLAVSCPGKASAHLPSPAGPSNQGLALSTYNIYRAEGVLKAREAATRPA